MCACILVCISSGLAVGKEQIVPLPSCGSTCSAAHPARRGVGLWEWVRKRAVRMLRVALPPSRGTALPLQLVR